MVPNHIDIYYKIASFIRIWLGGEVRLVFALANGNILGEELILDTFSIQIEFASGIAGCTPSKQFGHFPPFN